MLRFKNIVSKDPPNTTLFIYNVTNPIQLFGTGTVFRFVRLSSHRKMTTKSSRNRPVSSKSFYEKGSAAVVAGGLKITDRNYQNKYWIW